jgi:hypothetical protein
MIPIPDAETLQEFDAEDFNVLLINETIETKGARKMACERPILNSTGSRRWSAGQNTKSAAIQKTGKCRIDVPVTE